MKIKIILPLTILIITTSTHAGFGDILNKAEDITSVASEASKVISDPTGEKARQEQADKEDRERQERLAREEQVRKDRLVREEQERQERDSREKRQAERENLARKERLAREDRLHEERKEQAVHDKQARQDRLVHEELARKERKEKAAHDEQTRKEQTALQEQERQELIAEKKQVESDRKKKIATLVQKSRERIIERCDDWGDIEGDFIGVKNNYPMNLMMCIAERKNRTARRPVDIDKTFGTITLANLLLKKNKHGDWLIEKITDDNSDEKYNDQQRDFAADVIINSLLNDEYNSAKEVL